MSSEVSREVMTSALSGRTRKDEAEVSQSKEFYEQWGWIPALSSLIHFLSPLLLGPVHSFSALPRVPVLLHYLGLGTARLPQTLTGHLNCLVCTGKLCGFHQSLLSSLAIGVRDTNQICCLRRNEQWWRGKAV